MVTKTQQKIIFAIIDCKDAENESMDFVFKCIDCGKEGHSIIKATNGHNERCPWNYYLKCINCGYENNLGKLYIERDNSNYPVLVHPFGKKRACNCPY